MAESKDGSCETMDDPTSRMAGEEDPESLRFERLLSETSARFVGVSSDRIDAEIGTALRELREFFDLDRCIFLRGSLEAGIHLMHPDHLVCAPGVEPVPRDVDQLTLHPWLADQLRVHGIVNLTYDDVPSEATTDLQTMKRFGFRSVMVVRFVVGESDEYFVGGMSMRREQQLPDDLGPRLRLLAEIFVNTLSRCQAEKELRLTELKYRTVAEFAHDWEYWTEPDGRFRYVAPSCASITGYEAEVFQNTPSLLHDIVLSEDQGAWRRHHRTCHIEKRSGQLQFRIRQCDGQTVWLDHVCRPVFGPGGEFLGVRASNRNITDQKQTEAERNITLDLLKRASAARDLNELLRGTTGRLRQWLGCDAVGIRLREGDDYPYFETRGFSDEFVRAETRLCKTNEEACARHDSAGGVFLECMCGNVIAGRCDPVQPFVTECGSFWTNSTGELLATTSEADRLGPLRNRCHAEGYSSVALIPLRAGGRTFGLLQFNDRREGIFSPVLIGLCERLAFNIASAIAQHQATEALRSSERKLQHERLNLAEAQRIGRVGSWDFDYESQACTASEEALRIHGLDPRESDVAFRTLLDLVHPSDRDAVEAAIRRTNADPKEGYEMQYRLIRPDGVERFLHSRGEVVCDDAGRPVRMFGTTHDITDQKMAECSLRDALREVEKLKDRLHVENVYLKEEIKTSHDFDEIVGDSEPLRITLGKVQHVAHTDASVVLMGETGTGKELFARAIHARSQRKDRPLVKVNCAALPSALIESELFGHVKGAFTGAISDKLGRFHLADGATLFLDEIGELDLDLQSKLLRVLQEGEFEQIGSSKTNKVDVRIVAATNRDLHAEVKEGVFRPDLYYRLAVFPIEVPPLRVRRDDIPLLVWHFITQKNGKLGRAIDDVPAKVMNMLIKYEWPGNVRELENVVERAMILSPGRTLVLNETLEAPISAGRPLGSSASLDDVNRDHIINVLEECDWTIKGPGQAAQRLQLAPSTLRYRMKKLGIERPTRHPK